MKKNWQRELLVLIILAYLGSSQILRTKACESKKTQKLCEEIKCQWKVDLLVERCVNDKDSLKQSIHDQGEESELVFDDFDMSEQSSDELSVGSQLDLTDISLGDPNENSAFQYESTIKSQSDDYSYEYTYEYTYEYAYDYDLQSEENDVVLNQEENEDIKYELDDFEEFQFAGEETQEQEDYHKDYSDENEDNFLEENMDQQEENEQDDEQYTQEEIVEYEDYEEANYFEHQNEDQSEDYEEKKNLESLDDGDQEENYEELKIIMDDFEENNTEQIQTNDDNDNEENGDNENNGDNEENEENEQNSKEEQDNKEKDSPELPNLQSSYRTINLHSISFKWKKQTIELPHLQGQFLRVNQ